MRGHDVRTSHLMVKSLSAVLYGTGAHDTVSFVVGPLVIVAVAIADVIVLASRAMRANPLVALQLQ